MRSTKKAAIVTSLFLALVLLTVAVSFSSPIRRKFGLGVNPRSVPTGAVASQVSIPSIPSVEVVSASFTAYSRQRVSSAQATSSETLGKLELDLKNKASKKIVALTMLLGKTGRITSRRTVVMDEGGMPFAPETSRKVVLDAVLFSPDFRLQSVLFNDGTIDGDRAEMERLLSYMEGQLLAARKIKPLLAELVSKSGNVEISTAEIAETARRAGRLQSELRASAMDAERYHEMESGFRDYQDLKKRALEGITERPGTLPLSQRLAMLLDSVNAKAEKTQVP
jgi:hypothetical protein